MYVNNRMKKALITWITWQDWAYLAELLLKKWYEVHGVKRRTSLINTSRIDSLYQDPHVDNRKLFLHYGDMTDSTNLIKLVWDIQPDEIYNLAAQSHVAVSFTQPEYTANCDALGTLRLLEAIRVNKLEKKTKFYQASTSEMFWWIGYNMPETWYTEQSPFHPRSPYGVAKLYAYRIVVNYREAYGIYACNGLLFNHESPMRWETFVTRKITRAVAAISLWLQDKLYLGNMDAKRDRWHAKDYVEGMRRMLQQEEAKEYVLASWETYSVRYFVEQAFKEIGIAIRWEWTWVDEKWYNDATGECLVEVDPRYFRPSEVEVLLGDSSLARKELWRSPEWTLEAMIKDMVRSDLHEYKQKKILKEHGYEIEKQYE